MTLELLFLSLGLLFMFLELLPQPPLLRLLRPPLLPLLLRLLLLPLHLRPLLLPRPRLVRPPEFSKESTSELPLESIWLLPESIQAISSMVRIFLEFSANCIEITQVLGIPASAISDVTIDLDQSSSTQTVIEFTIWNELKSDGTRVKKFPTV
jgi:hypothetical protein